MGTSVSIMSGFDQVKKQVEEGKKERKKEQDELKKLGEESEKIARERLLADAETALKEEEIKAKEKIFDAQKTNLLAAKTASAKARMAANGVADTSASLRALQAAAAAEAEEEIKNSGFFADLDLKKLELANRKAAAKSESLVSPASQKKIMYFR